MSIIIIICTILLFYLLINRIYSEIVRGFQQYKILNKYKKYQAILQTYLEMSYDTIYKDQILAYHLDSTRVDSETLETIKRNYIKLTFELMGPNVVEICLEFYSSKPVLISNMLLYFQSRIDNDTTLEIMKKRQSEQ